MFCPKCGNELANGAKFCGTCGQKIMYTGAGDGANTARQGVQSTQNTGAQQLNAQQNSADAGRQDGRRQQSSAQGQNFDRQQSSAQGQNFGRQQSSAQEQYFGAQQQNSAGQPRRENAQQDHAGQPRRENTQQPDKSKKVLAAVSAAAGVLVLAAVIVVVLFAVPSKADQYQEKISLGEQYLTDGDYEQAIVAYTEAIEIDDQQTDAYMGRAAAYTALALAEDGEEDAEGDTAESAEDDAEDAAKEENLNAALADYAAVVALDPEQTQAYVAAADIYVNQLGEYEKAEALLEDGLEENPEDEELSAALDETQEQAAEAEQTESYAVYTAVFDELTAEYGTFAEEQTGTMFTVEDEWLDASGVLGAAISDLDADGSPEMLVCIAEACEHFDDDDHVFAGFYHVMLYVYEAEDGQAVQADSILLGEYSTIDTGDSFRSMTSEMLILSDECFERFLEVSLAEADSRQLILCENQGIMTAFGDGSLHNMWLLEYTGSKLRYVGSFSQEYEGSAGFEYTVYQFEEGECVSSDVYYSEDYGWYDGASEPLYDDFAEAVSAFLGLYGISASENISRLSFTSVLPEDNAGTLVFSFTNRLTESDWETNTYTYSAELTNDLSQIDGEEDTGDAADAGENEGAADEDDSADAADIDWAKAYLDYLADAQATDEGFDGTGLTFTGESGYFGIGMFYLNDDDIPELVLYGDCEATGCILLTVSADGEVQKLQTSRLNCYYLEKGNVLNNADGIMGGYYDWLYSIDENGTWQKIASGDYYAVDDDYDNLEYYWNGTQVSEEEYEAYVNSYIDEDEARNLGSTTYGGDQTYLNLSQMRTRLEELAE